MNEKLINANGQNSSQKISFFLFSQQKKAAKKEEEEAFSQPFLPFCIKSIIIQMS